MFRGERSWSPVAREQALRSKRCHLKSFHSFLHRQRLEHVWEKHSAEGHRDKRSAGRNWCSRASIQGPNQRLRSLRVDWTHRFAGRWALEILGGTGTIARCREAHLRHPVLFLIDEMLSGTNSHERCIIACEVISALLRGKAVGAISTHDLCLTELADRSEISGINLHMQSENPDDPLDFDYRLKPGKLRHTNAVAILRLIGI